MWYYPVATPYTGSGENSGLKQKGATVLRRPPIFSAIPPRGCARGLFIDLQHSVQEVLVQESHRTPFSPQELGGRSPRCRFRGTAKGTIHCLPSASRLSITGPLYHTTPTAV